MGVQTFIFRQQHISDLKYFAEVEEAL